MFIDPYKINILIRRNFIVEDDTRYRSTEGYLNGYVHLCCTNALTCVCIYMAFVYI